MTVWVTPAEARADWPDAPSDDDRLARHLDAAQEQCENFLPTAEADGYNATVPVPNRVKFAVIFQARENVNAGAAEGSSDIVGVGDFAIRRRPLTMAVRQLLRPKRAFGPLG